MVASLSVNHSFVRCLPSLKSRKPSWRMTQFGPEVVVGGAARCTFGKCLRAPAYLLSVVRQLASRRGNLVSRACRPISWPV